MVFSFHERKRREPPRSLPPLPNETMGMGPRPSLLALRNPAHRPRFSWKSGRSAHSPARVAPPRGLQGIQGSWQAVATALRFPSQRCPGTGHSRPTRSAPRFCSPPLGPTWLPFAHRDRKGPRVFAPPRPMLPHRIARQLRAPGFDRTRRTPRQGDAGIPATHLPSSGTQTRDCGTSGRNRGFFSWRGFPSAAGLTPRAFPARDGRLRRDPHAHRDRLRPPRQP